MNVEELIKWLARNPGVILSASYSSERKHTTIYIEDKFRKDLAKMRGGLVAIPDIEMKMNPIREVEYRLDILTHNFENFQNNGNTSADKTS